MAMSAMLVPVSTFTKASANHVVQRSTSEETVCCTLFLFFCIRRKTGLPGNPWGWRSLYEAETILLMLQHQWKGWDGEGGQRGAVDSSFPHISSHDEHAT
eukprot:1187721-Rhodomonas_salina.1